MKSSNNQQTAGSECLRRGALRLAALAFVFGASEGSQSVPASINTIPQPHSDRPFFDASGNTYFLYGPPTAGAAQTQPGGGTCLGATNRGIAISLPCPDAALSKFDTSGNQVWGTLLGGPTADIGTALAVDTKGNVFLTGRTAGQFPMTPGAGDRRHNRGKVNRAAITMPSLPQKAKVAPFVLDLLSPQMESARKSHEIF